MDEARRLLFTGDIGRVRDNEVATRARWCTPGHTKGETADVLVMESTYGNRQHPDGRSTAETGRDYSRTVQRGGSVVVPAFAVERTQKFLFVLKELMESGQIAAYPGVLR